MIRNKGIRARNKQITDAMWEDRKQGWTYGELAKKYKLHGNMHVRNRFRYWKLPYQKLTKELQAHKAKWFYGALHMHRARNHVA